MTTNELDEEIKQLALEIEREIAKNRKRLNELPDFAPRSQRSRKMERKVARQS